MTAPGVPLDPPAPATVPGDLLPLTRLALLVLLGLSIANGIFLYLQPARAATGYAWSIKPALNAAFLGAGYLTGAVSAAVSLVLVRRWRSIQAMVWPLVVFGILMLIATVIHRDRFRWGYPLTWIWTAVYVAVPIGAAGVWLWQRRAEPERAGTGRIADPLSTVAAVIGVALVIVGALMYLLPTAAIDRWPWSITPLLARAFGAWYVLAGGILFVAGAFARSRSETAVPYLTVAAWNLLLVILPLTYRDTIHTDTTAFALWLALHLLTLLVCAAGAMRSLRMMRTVITT